MRYILNFVGWLGENCFPFVSTHSLGHALYNRHLYKGKSSSLRESSLEETCTFCPLHTDWSLVKGWPRMYSTGISTNQSDLANSDARPNKRRRKKSDVWEHFTIEKISGDCVRACCKLCKKSFAYISGSKMSGTSHLKRHIAKGICPVSRYSQEKDLLTSCTTAYGVDVSSKGTNLPRNRRAAKRAENVYLNVDNCSDELVNMIIQHDYPLHMVRDPGFIAFARMLQPQYNIPSVTAVQERIMSIYFRERQKILDLLGRSSGRINLTADLQFSNQDLAYILLTGYFIDHDWKLQSRILDVATLQFSESDTAFGCAIASCLSSWSSEDKLFTITLDHAFVNGDTRDNLRNLLSIRNSSRLNGQLLVNSCYARLLRSLAQDAIGSMRETVEKVRHSVKHVKTSAICEERFTKMKQQLQVPSAKNLVIDDLTKWNTTYQMLMAASELKEVFACLDTSDPDYKLTLSMEDWRQIETLCTYLKIFYEATSILTAPGYPTTNLFFQEAWEIHHELIYAAVSKDLFVQSLTKPLQEKFSKYWEDCFMVLAVAAAMDPRFKMKLVEFSFPKVYGEDAETWIKIVDDGLHELYFEYVVLSLPPPTFIEETNDSPVKSEISQEDGLLSHGDVFADFDIYISDIMGGQHMKSELDQYLEEPLLPRVQDFDVLGWWNINRSKYPTLSKMAADVLSIPLLTVSPESVFDTREKVMDNHLSSLSPTTLKALICVKDWLQHESPEIPATPVKTEF